MNIIKCIRFRLTLYSVDPNGKITGTMKINANFNIIAPGEAGDFKSYENITF